MVYPKNWHLNHIPWGRFYADARGCPFIISWCHRVSGLLLVGYVWFHIYTLRILSSPPIYDATMRFYSFSFSRILEWALAIPAIFHTFNGGRLILYEIFGYRNDASMICWMLGLSFGYLMLLAFFMLLGSQNVSPVFFWLITLVAGVVFAYRVASKMWRIPHSLSWKFQRITGAYLLILIPAHLLFMHLNHGMAHDATTVILRMQNPFIKGLNIILILGVLYHGGYGLWSLIGDYIGSKRYRLALGALVLIIMGSLAFVGIKLTLLVLHS